MNYFKCTILNSGFIPLLQCNGPIFSPIQLNEKQISDLRSLGFNVKVLDVPIKLKEDKKEIEQEKPKQEKLKITEQEEKKAEEVVEESSVEITSEDNSDDSLEVQINVLDFEEVSKMPYNKLINYIKKLNKALKEEDQISLTSKNKRSILERYSSIDFSKY